MNETEEKLRNETEKWLGKMEAVKVVAADGPAEKLLQNMRAYVSDSKHFLLKKDFIRAFECVIWAWSIYELCTDIGIFRKG